MTTPTDSPDAPEAQAVRLALTMLGSNLRPSQAEVTGICDAVYAMQTARGLVLDRQVLQREVETLVSVWQDDSVELVSDEGHIEWLSEARADRSWPFWDRYRRYLEDVKGMPPAVVRQLDRSTEKVLRRLEDPQRQGPWRRDGLVVGQVQSGKTGNYIGLACKAADAGYRLVVILAGIHNSLRSQTQLRVDEGLLGFDTQYQKRSDEGGRSSAIGVGAMAGVSRLAVASLTTSAENGDFGRAVASNTNMPASHFPVVLVVKKHTSILKYLRTWIVEVEGVPTVAGGPKSRVPDVPLLVIDDEADHASVNTNDEDTDPSKVNAAIRELLHSFNKSAYVGYTATPFANIYILPHAHHDKFGADLFPSAFIDALQAPSNYFGPDRVFGLNSEDPDVNTIEALPVVRSISDEAGWMPDKHKRDWRPPKDLPKSLVQAMESFVLTCATRRARGQRTVHNSMLVHVTRFVDVQNLVTESVDDWVRLTRDRIRDRYSEASRSTIERLRSWWEEDYVKTTDHWPAAEAARVEWKDVRRELLPALDRIQVRAINGSSQDALTYYEHRRTGLSVIAIGGDKLSRGLTLEGLTVSYYLRSSKTYDTLLQMGRWFGYRPGFEDLCRLYTTTHLRNAYTEIASADDELRRDFEEMAALSLTPEQFGLRVRTSKLQLSITAANKMRSSELVRISFSRDIPETTVMNLDKSVVNENQKNLTNFVTRLDRLGQPEQDGGWIWKGVKPDEIVEGFLEGYRGHPSSHRVRPRLIGEYIRRCAARGELGDWTVKLASSRNGFKTKIAGRDIGLIRRAPTGSVSAADTHYSTRRIVSPSDETVGLSSEQLERARAASRGAGETELPKVPKGPQIRDQRMPDQALLIIYPLANPVRRDGDPDPKPRNGSVPSDEPLVVGFAISFPRSPSAVWVEYRVNQIWSQEQLDDLTGQDNG